MDSRQPDNTCRLRTAATPSQPLADGFCAPAGELHSILAGHRIVDDGSLRPFLAAWLELSVVRVDLPIIRWAYESAARNDANDLIALDQQVSATPTQPALRAASVRIGQQKLRGFASLKGHTFLRRYYAAVESGQASGHNAVVYGIYLFLFSIPLREGLLSYGYQTLKGFAETASAAIRLDIGPTQALIEQLSANLPKQVEGSLTVKREPVPAASNS
jgi:urease accessory protein